MKFTRTLLTVVALIAPVLLASCGKREDTKLAEFKDRSITIAEYEDAYANVDPVFLPKNAGEEGRLEFLNTMLNKEVMAFKADELGYDKDPAVVQGMDGFMKMGLQAGYLKRRIVDKVTVTEEMVRKHYDLRGTSLSVKQILVDTPEEADLVYDMLEDGADFDSVVREHSKSPDAAGGGNVMTVSYGQFMPDMEKQLFDLEVGEYTEPMQSPYGYFIMKVLRKTEASRKEPYDDIEERLWQEVRVREEMVETNKATDEIRADYGVTWYWDGIAVAYNALPADRSLNNPPRRQDEVYPLLYFDEVDYNKPVVSFNNKTITVKDFSDYYDQASFFARPRREFRLGGIRTFMLERIMSEIVPLEMKRSRIEEDPEVARAITAKREELMVNRLYEDMVNKQTVVTFREIQEYYGENPELFQVPEKRRFGVILCGDKAAIDQAYADIQSGELFRNVAMAYSIDETTRKSMGETELLNRGEQPELDRIGFELPRVGAVSEPFETSRGWMILKLTERQDPRQYTIDEVRGSIEGALKQAKNEERLNELLAKWKEELEVVIYEGNLGKLQLPDRSAAAPEATTASR